MAKSGKKSTNKTEPEVSGPLAPAIEVFSRGDYQSARVLLERAAANPELSDGARDEARSLIAATRVERETLYVGLACLCLLVLVLVTTALTQP